MGRLFDGQLIPLKEFCSRRSSSTLKEEVNLVKKLNSRNPSHGPRPRLQRAETWPPRAACTRPSLGGPHAGSRDQRRCRLRAPLPHAQDPTPGEVPV